MTGKRSKGRPSFAGSIGQATLDFLNQAPIELVIGSGAVPALSGEIYDLVYPATGEIVTRVYHGGIEDAARAVESARAAFDRGDWSRLSPRQKSRILEGLASLVEESAAVFAELETLQTGKPITEARGDVARAIEGIRFYAAAAQMCRGETITVSRDFHSYTLREPLGVVGAIVPWNVPLVLTVSKAAPALAVGNSVVVKPATQTPLTALLLARKGMEAGLPPGVLNVVTGSGSTVGNLLAAHPLIDGITFTGSTETGRAVAASAVASHKRLQLELGGKSPNILFADAELARAISESAAAIFYGQGEICSAGSRLLVQRTVFDEVVNGVAQRANALIAGDPLDERTELGSLISRAHLQSVKAHVDAAVEAGARIVAGGDELRLQGFENGAFMSPTVLTGAAADSKVAQEEIFGPVLVALPFDSEEEAVTIANNTRYGLAAGVWTNDAARGRRLAERLRSGVVWINTYNQFDTSMPFGGVKASGGGSREWSHLALDSFTETKAIWERI